MSTMHIWKGTAVLQLRNTSFKGTFKNIHFLSERQDGRYRGCALEDTIPVTSVSTVSDCVPTTDLDVSVFTSFNPITKPS